MTRSLINSLIEYYSKSLSSILEVLVLFEIKTLNNKLNIIQINILDIKLTLRIYILNLVVILFYNFTHIYVSYNSSNQKNLNELIDSTIVLNIQLLNDFSN